MELDSVEVHVYQLELVSGRESTEQHAYAASHGRWDGIEMKEK
jgi:hypothetical protein